jgi:ParB/RepB/Spo0J family partition protein
VETPIPAVESQEKGIERQQIVTLDISEINVPRERVTAVWEAAQEEEFHNSIKAKGILEPVAVMQIDGEYWLIDGLHRIQEAEKLGLTKIAAIVKDGKTEDLLIENLIRMRQRGKSNPAQEADVLMFLVTARNFPLDTAAKQMGLSLDWAKKLLKIATLPEEVKDHIKVGKIPVTGAFYIADLPNAGEQLSVARDAALYSYNAYQIKARVGQMLNPDREPEEGSFTFTPNGAPKKIPLRCRFCAAELPDVGKQYVWVCSECEELAADLLPNYRKALKEQSEEKH